MAIEARRRTQLQLTRIDAALHRIDSGNSGQCNSCGEAIGPHRLQVDPATAFCVECASDRE